LLFFIIAVIPSPAQTTGQIEGLVLDPANLPIPNALLHFAETGTGAERQVKTDERGWYLAPALATGSYEIDLEHPGFRREIRRGVTLSAGRVARIDFKLQLGKPSDTVIVTGEASPVSATSGDWMASIERLKLDSLPLNGRDLFDLSSQQPGTTVATTSNKSMTTGSGIRLSVNGARPNQNGFRLDGVYINDATSSAPTSAGGRLLGIESIEELHVVSSPFDAEYGRAGGAVLTAVSKSGSNQWHGSAYEFFRNSALDAKNFFNPAEEEIPPLRKNQFGGLISGPVMKNRLFFLVNYEGVRETSSRTISSVTPNSEARLGQLPGGTVEVAPEAVPYLELYPLPNGRDYGDGTGEYITNGITSSREDYVTGKLDVIFSNRLRHSLRYTYDNAFTTRPEPLNIYTFLDDSHYHFLHTETQFFQSAGTVHSLGAGFSRVWNSQDNNLPPCITPSLSFVPGLPMGRLAMTSGMSSFGGGRGDNVSLFPRRFVVNDFQVNYTLTHVRGKHTLKAGGSFNRLQFNQRSDNSAKGTYTFSSLADFLQGAPRSGEMMMVGSDTIRGWRQNFLSGFIQDEFRAGARLTITLGLRYEPYSTPTEVNGKIATLPDPVHDSAVTVGGALFENPSKTNFAPRVALAFDPFGTSKTVIRAGAGVFFDPLSTRDLVISGVRLPPFFEEVSLSWPEFPNMYEAAQNATPLNTIDMLDYYVSQPYIMQFHLLVQEELTRGLVLQLGYAGARGVHLSGAVEEMNPTRPEVLPGGQLYFPASMIRINTAFSRIRGRWTQFDSSYHGFQTSLESRWQRGFTLQFKYAWSKSLDNNSTAIRNDFLNTSYVPNMFDFSLNRGRSDFDLRHVFTGNFSWQIPYGKDNGIGRVLGDWELIGKIQAQSGPGFSPTVGFDRARLSKGGAGDVGQRPIYAGSPDQDIILGHPSRWFDASVFELPPAGMYGDLGRNVLEGPGLLSLDLALHKVIWHTERQSIRFRAEAFNVTNHPNFQMPSSLALFTSSLNRVGSAGQITDTATAARQIQLALQWTF
jgi:hypothetical protein